MIPKTIFFLCKDKNNISPELIENINFVKEQNPDYNLIIYDNKSFEYYYKKKDLNSFKNYYSKLNKNYGAMIADYMRYVLMYYEGGVYMDLKSRPKVPLNNFIDSKNNDMILFIWEQKGRDAFREYLNYFLISKKNNKFYKEIINQIHTNIDNYDPIRINLSHSRKNVLEFTGPRIFTEVFDYYLKKQNYTKNMDITIYNNEEKKKLIQYSFLGNYHNHHKKIYKDKHYSKIKEHLILLQ